MVESILINYQNLGVLFCVINVLRRKKMKAINNYLIDKVRNLSNLYDRNLGEDVALFLNYESEQQYKAMRKDKTMTHYSNDNAVRDVSVQCYNVFERYVRLQEYRISEQKDFLRD
jgi:hypothetical protein